jgi:hypothetical protein
VSRFERGLLDGVSIPSMRQIAKALEVRIDLVPRWRGGELDRMLNRDHAALHEAFARYLGAQPGWQIRPEVSFSVYGERGVIDVLAWHPARAAVLVVELKTQLVDVMDLISTMDRRRRLAPRIAAEIGWQPASVSALVVLTGNRTNRRRAVEHRTVLQAAFPSDGRRLAGWLRDPREPIAILAMWPHSHDTTHRPVVSQSGSRSSRLGTAIRTRPRTIRATGSPQEAPSQPYGGSAAGQ